jgi:molybdopterin/thiamine biosynthesis adenylyltransferase
VWFKDIYKHIAELLEGILAAIKIILDRLSKLEEREKVHTKKVQSMSDELNKLRSELEKLKAEPKVINNYNTYPSPAPAPLFPIWSSYPVPGQIYATGTDAATAQSITEPAKSVHIPNWALKPSTEGSNIK